MESRNYHISLNRQLGGGFVAKCIGLPGCLSEGKTESEALKNIRDAIRLYLEDVEAEAKENKAKLVQRMGRQKRHQSSQTTLSSARR